MGGCAPEFSKFTVIAGIAMTQSEKLEDVTIISFGTGTKCISGENISMCGASVNDFHAEIISRRCFKSYLYDNLEIFLKKDGKDSILMRKENGKFCVKPGIKFHLYINTAPCGDGRVFCFQNTDVDPHPERRSRGMLRTKREAGKGTTPLKGDAYIQTWDSILPGHEQLLTMSCSDKIASWNVLGLQGALLSHFIDPIYLDTVILTDLFQREHLQRALYGRIEHHIKDLPEFYCMNKPRLAVTDRQKILNIEALSKSTKKSINWTLGLEKPEILLTTNGKLNNGETSRLSKRSFFDRFIKIYGRLFDSTTAPRPPFYGAFKKSATNYQIAQKSLEKAFIDAGFGHWAKKPPEVHEFEPQ